MSEQKGKLLIRTMICEDLQLLREGLVALLSQATDIEVVAQLHSSDGFVQMAIMTQPDIAVIDIDMPGSSAALTRLPAVLPGCRAVALTDGTNPGLAGHPAAAHVEGLVLKAASVEFMLDTVRRVAGGERVVDPAFPRHPQAPSGNPLTPREAIVLQEAAEGISTAEIADRLGLSRGTVRNYISRAIAKTGARNRLHAVRIADRNGWLPPI